MLCSYGSGDSLTKQEDVAKFAGERLHDRLATLANQTGG